MPLRRGGRTPNGKYHLKFPFWLFEPFPYLHTLVNCPFNLSWWSFFLSACLTKFFAFFIAYSKLCSSKSVKIDILIFVFHLHRWPWFLCAREAINCGLVKLCRRMFCWSGISSTASQPLRQLGIYPNRIYKYFKEAHYLKAPHLVGHCPNTF